MATRLTEAEFIERFELPEWTAEGDRIVVTYRAPSYEAAALLVLEIARAAEAAEHHPDIDLRYPGRLHVALTTHAAGGLTELDAGLAATVTQLAAAADAVIELRS